jgi:G:T-mismatch repair DNA endonuclease (very short patch repair protein)
MEKIECLICNKKISNNNSYIGSHVKRIHGIDLIQYVEKYYENLDSNFRVEKCGFCSNKAIPKYDINHKEKVFSKNYQKGFFCYEDICKENISLDILGIPYNKKSFEHIGANSAYLCKLHKKPIELVNYSKSKGFRDMKFTTSLKGYIEKYGDKIGTEKYKERCQKISKCNTLLWFKEKYGDKIGTEKYSKFRKKKHKGLGPSKSKASKLINTILDQNGVKYIEEYKYNNLNGQNGLIDFYIPDYNIVIEFYGDYWHCNPNIYGKNYFHQICKKSSIEIWENDKNRINHIFQKEFHKDVTILIIWESTKISGEYLMELIKSIKGKNTIVEI